MADQSPNDDFAPVEGESNSSAGILAALKKSEDAFEFWQATCSTIDEIYSKDGQSWDSLREYEWTDADLDLFWASFEIMKEAVYARPPQPVVSPIFRDNRQLQNVTSELLERCAVSTFKHTHIHENCIEVRDDVLFAGRGVLWNRYETDDGQTVCIEHVDRTDFRCEPARYWRECGWAARRSWLIHKDAVERFGRDKADMLSYVRHQKDKDWDERDTTTPKASVWEVWHKGNNKVYWVSEGVADILDQMEPEVKLSDFFPCPKPAFGTLRRRSLIPVPDWERYRIHFAKINDATSKIYTLLNDVKMAGLIGGGGDVADAVQDLLESDDTKRIIRVNSIGNIAESIAWLPLDVLSATITGMIEARRQLIEDFYQLSGISDIMRGATEAEETLGAQQLKSQYGSVRIRGKSTEIQRLLADSVRIAAEMIAEKFSSKTLLEMGQMEIPTKADLDKRVKEIEKSAREELQALGKKAQEAAQRHPEDQPIDPAQAKQALEQAQQQILAKYAPQLAEVENSVPLEDVMKLLRDDKARNFSFEIASDSTILVDEMSEKASRNEFMQVLTGSMAQLPQIAPMGPEAINLWGELVRFNVAPYRVGRSLDGEIDKFIDAAPEIAQRMSQQAQGGEAEGLVEAQKGLAEAEKVKAQAAMAGVQAKSELDKAEMQRKMVQMQLDAQKQQQAAQEAVAKLQLQMQKQQDEYADKSAQTEAQINKLTAETAKILASIGLDERKQQLSEYTAANQAQAQKVDQAMAIEGQEQDAQFRSAQHDRAERQQDFSEQTGERQMTIAERQAEQGED